MIDLHTHSTASDGDHAPADLVHRAAGRGVRVLALTDHDTMDGVAEAVAAGEEAGVRVIPAVELSVRVPRGSLHMLGYFPTTSPQPLGDHLAAAHAARIDRAARMVANLAALGAPVALDDVLARAQGNVGRPHIADALVAAGHCSSRRQAFDQYLSDRGPAYVGYDAPTPTEALALIRASGGVAVLAHPASLGLPAGHLASAVQRLAARGLAGIEVHRPEHDAVRRRAYVRLARAFRLVPSGGSDYHRPGDGVEPGDTGDPPLDPGTADALLERAVAPAAPPAPRDRLGE